MPRYRSRPPADSHRVLIRVLEGASQRARPRRSAAVALAAGLLALAGCTSAATRASSPGVRGTTGSMTAAANDTPSARPSHAPARTDATRSTDLSGDAETLLATLSVKGRAPMTGYSREAFGSSWSDTDTNGCDTRDDVLTRDLANPLYETDASCVVVAGDLADPYTGTTIHFTRGDGDLVDIDHVVALGNSWATGAFRWDASKRLEFANDPSNLLAVDASANRQKGDGDTATWLPSNKDYRCAYVARQIWVKATYGLWVTPPERDAMTHVLARCPGQDLPTSGSPGTPTRTSAQVRTTGEPQRSSSTNAGSTSFANCDAARAAGAAPVHRGDLGYSLRLDRDGDGTGCE